FDAFQSDSLLPGIGREALWVLGCEQSPPRLHAQLPATFVSQNQVVSGHSDGRSASPQFRRESAGGFGGVFGPRGSDYDPRTSASWISRICAACRASCAPASAIQWYRESGPKVGCGRVRVPSAKPSASETAVLNATVASSSARQAALALSPVG